MGLFDEMFGNSDPTTTGSIPAVAPPASPPPAGGSILQQYLLAPMGVDQGTSDGLNSVVQALGASMLQEDRYNWFPGFSDNLRLANKDLQSRQSRAAMQSVLKAYGFSDEEAAKLSVNKDAAEFAIAQKQSLAATQAGQSAAGVMGGLLGGGGFGANDNSRMSPAAPAGPAAGASLNGTKAEKAKAVYDGLIQRGMSPVLAAGMVGNIDVESGGFNTAAVGDDGTAFGYHQARGDRFNNLKSIAQARGVGWQDHDAQLDNIAAEFGGKDAGMAKAKALIEADPNITPQKAAEIIARYGERPSAKALAESMPRRAGTAGQVFSLYGQRPPTQVAAGSAAPGVVADDGGSVAPGVSAGPAPITPVTSRPLGAPRVQVAENEDQTQILEGRMGMLPSSVYGITREAQARQPSQADIPSADAMPAEFVIPPGQGGADPSRYGPVTQRALAIRSGSAPSPLAANALPPAQRQAADFPLNDPAKATKAIPELYRVLSILNLPDAQKAQAKSMLDYALNVVKPTDRTRQLMEAGFTPGTPEYREAYKNLINSDRTPSGYRFAGDGRTLEPIPGGPQDPSNKGAKAPPPGYRAIDGGERFEPIPGGPADPTTITAQAAAKASGKPAAGLRPLPQNAVKDLAAAGESYGDLNRIAGSFRPDYAGWKVGKVGEAANQLARTTGIGNTEAADWWSDYAMKRNVVRNKLFGSALTSQEKAEFEKADITPGMTPDAIQKVLARQQAAASGAARKLVACPLRSGPP